MFFKKKIIKYIVNVQNNNLFYEIKYVYIYYMSICLRLTTFVYIYVTYALLKKLRYAIGHRVPLDFNKMTKDAAN